MQVVGHTLSDTKPEKGPGSYFVLTLDLHFEFDLDNKKGGAFQPRLII
jgi:hypothetical protein